MDIVKCPNPECNAEQEIWIDRDGDVACAFCGTKITELPEGVDLDAYRSKANAKEHLIDGYEAGALPADAPAAPVKEGKGKAVTADFALSYGEVEQALYGAERINQSKVRQIVFTVVLGAMLCWEISNLINLLRDGKNVTMTVILLVMVAFLIPYLWWSPKSQIKKYIKSVADGTVLHATLYEDFIRIKADNSDGSTKVPLDGESAELLETETQWMLSVKKTGSLVVLPKQYFVGQEEIVSERLTAGTTPYVTRAEKKAREKAERTAKKQPKNEQ